MENIGNKQWLYKKYVIENKGMKAISKICGCSMWKVSNKLREFKIPVKGCGDNKRGNTPSGTKHWRWKGGQYITKEGYIKVLTPKDHPYKGRYMSLHRLVMEQKLGRCLSKKEVVHHIDGNKLNNTEDNLQLMTGGQSEHQKLEGSKRKYYPLLWKDGWIKREYVSNRRSMMSIAIEVGCNEGTVRYAIKTLGIPRRKYTMTNYAYESRMKGINKMFPTR